MTETNEKSTEELSSSESGLQLFARLCPRPSLSNLCLQVFPNGPDLSQPIRLRGTAKTNLLTHFIHNAIVPVANQEDYIGGCGAGVLLIDTTQQFSVPKLANWIRNTILKKKGDTSKDKIDAILKHSLENLHVIRCYDDQKLQAIAKTTGVFLFQNPSINLLVIDSVDQFYYQHIATAQNVNRPTIDNYEKRIVDAFQKAIGSSPISFVFSSGNYTRKAGRSIDKINNNYCGEINIEKNDASFSVKNIEGNESRFVLNDERIQWLM